MSIPKIVEILVWATVEPPQRYLTVYKEDSGWMYIRKLVEKEGWATVFAFKEELEAVAGAKLKLLETHKVERDER